MADRKDYDARTLRYVALKARRRVARLVGDSRPEYMHLDNIADELLEEARSIERKAKRNG